MCGDTVCWHGISVRTSTSDDVYRVLAQQGYTLIDTYIFSTDLVATRPDSCAFRVHLTPDNGINLLNLNTCPNVLLGDVMALFGTPDDLSVCDTRLTLYYNPGHTVEARLDDKGGFSMYSEVFTVTFYPLERPHRWNGFAPIWRYQQLYPIAPFIYPCF